MVRHGGARGGCSRGRGYGKGSECGDEVQVSESGHESAVPHVSSQSRTCHK